MPEAITVHCPSCETPFPVDPAKVPPGGVRARCSVCHEIFPVEVPSGEESVPDAEREAGEVGGGLAVEEPGAAEEPAGAGPGIAPEPEVAEEEEQQPEPAPEESSAAAEEPAAPRPSFGQRSPEEKAERLARVLVSDMITYNPELYEEAVEQGTLKEDFEEEIEKSWEEYVEQVGEEMAESTSHWTNALNEILARGDDVF